MCVSKCTRVLTFENLSQAWCSVPGSLQVYVYIYRYMYICTYVCISDMYISTVCRYRQSPGTYVYLYTYVYISYIHVYIYRICIYICINIVYICDIYMRSTTPARRGYKSV
jgi:hypothetical protein